MAFMPHFRFIIEGRDIKMPSFSGEADEYVTGFFTTRRARGVDEDTARAAVLRSLEEEWADHSPRLSVLDAWRTRLFEFPPVPNAGHVFFSDNYSRYAAASIEAEAARAPKSATIWQLASLHASDDD